MHTSPSPSPGTGYTPPARAVNAECVDCRLKAFDHLRKTAAEMAQAAYERRVAEREGLAALEEKL